MITVFMNHYNEAIHCLRNAQVFRDEGKYSESGVYTQWAGILAQLAALDLHPDMGVRDAKDGELLTEEPGRGVPK